jgi:hypothetical protein
MFKLAIDQFQLRLVSRDFGLRSLQLIQQVGRSCEWIKVKTAAWRAANADRGEMFGY